MSASANRLTAALGLLVLATGTAPTLHAQQSEVALHAAFAGEAVRASTPAIAWLCDDFLPSLPAWPEGLDPSEPFAIELGVTHLSIRATDATLPADAIAIGSLTFAEGRSDPLLWQCGRDGIEQWFVPANFVLPARWQRVLHTICADRIDASRTLSVPVAAGHLAGSLLEGDPRAVALRLGAALCGDAIWLAWRHDGEIRVRGQSAGGLMIPAALLAMAMLEGAGTPSALSLRAFAARDSDREEATRQLSHSERELTADVGTLRSLLLGNDRLRLTAIDALVRHQACDELPRIVAAADADHPWATLAAKTALASLWPSASPATRAATRKALRERGNPALRAPVDAHLPTHPGASTDNDASPGAPRARLLFVLFLSCVSLLGLWMRARIRG